MISLVVKAVDGGTECYGKNASELQQNITITESEISGTLNKIDDYSEAFPDASEKAGHFLAIAFTFDEGTTVKTKLEGGKKGDVDVTKDKYCVYRIENKDTQKIKITATKGEKSTEKTYSLAKLNLAD